MKIAFTYLLLFISAHITNAHKYYLSVTDLEYNKEEQSIQMITRLFYDDLQDVLQERYDERITVKKDEDQEKLDAYINRYLKKKFKVKVNNIDRELRFLGKEYEDDYVVCYIEIEAVSSIETILIENTLLMDLFPEQKNMIHTDILEKKKSLLLHNGNAKALLKF